MKKHKKEIILEGVKSFLIIIAALLIIRTFFIGNFKIPTSSMYPTLQIGDRLLANMLIYKIRKPVRGEVVIFKYPLDPKRDFVKRLIGLPGERVLIKDGRIYINGKVVKNPLINCRYYYEMGEYGVKKEVEVPPHSYYVLGDNSFNSKDSRYWGFVPEKYLLGKALFIYWPPWRMGIIR